MGDKDPSSITYKDKKGMRTRRPSACQVHDVKKGKTQQNQKLTYNRNIAVIVKVQFHKNQ